MFEFTISDEKKPGFIPFTLNIRLTTGQSAKNLYKLLKPLFHELDEAKVNREQRQMVGMICGNISERVVNIDD